MGIGGIGVWQLLIVFGIAILVFGTSRLKTVGSDLGSAIKGFRKAMESDDGNGSPSGGGSVEAPHTAISDRLEGDPSERLEASKVEKRA